MAVPSVEPPASSASPSTPIGDPDRILTVPNGITLVRLLCLPVFVWLLFGRDDRVAAAVLLAALGATDWCDGYVARHFHQQSNVGKLFDPTVDRLLFFVAVTSIAIDGSAPRWFCAAVLLREVTVAAITVTLTAMGVRPVDVIWFGKAGTLCLMVAFPLFLGGSSDVAFAATLTAVAWVFGLAGLVLSYYAAARYVPEWRRNLATRHADGAGGGAVAQGPSGNG